MTEKWIKWTTQVAGRERIDHIEINPAYVEELEFRLKEVGDTQADGVEFCGKCGKMK